jgi:hypothetical protein
VRPLRADSVSQPADAPDTNAATRRRRAKAFASARSRALATPGARSAADRGQEPDRDDEQGWQQEQ